MTRTAQESPVIVCHCRVVTDRVEDTVDYAGRTAGLRITNDGTADSTEVEVNLAIGTSSPASAASSPVHRPAAATTRSAERTDPSASVTEATSRALAAPYAS